jgi:hypothetical protein
LYSSCHNKKNAPAHGTFKGGVVIFACQALLTQC